MLRINHQKDKVERRHPTLDRLLVTCQVKYLETYYRWQKLLTTMHLDMDMVRLNDATATCILLPLPHSFFSCLHFLLYWLMLTTVWQSTSMHNCHSQLDGVIQWSSNNWWQSSTCSTCPMSPNWRLCMRVCVCVLWMYEYNLMWMCRGCVWM